MAVVLVTGGAGYVGSHACKALAAAGHTPVTYDNLVHGHDWAVKWGPLERGDILDQARLEAVIAHHRPVAVMHFAAFAYVGESVADPAKYYRNNLAGALAVLDAMRAGGVDRMVFSSTCATYGEPDALPIREDSPQRPINPYGASKLMVERVLADYAAAYGLKAVALRYFNAAGADPDGELGEAHDPETHLIPLVLDVAAGARANITIHGQDYDTPDGACLRDYVHVSDLADAHVRALDFLAGATPGLAVYNLAAGEPISVLEVIAAARRITGRNIPAVAGPRRPGDPPALFADPARARADLSWSPRLSDLDTLIATAWRWRMGADPGARATA